LDLKTTFLNRRMLNKEFRIMKVPFKEFQVSSVNKDQPSKGGCRGKCIIGYGFWMKNVIERHVPWFEQRGC